MRHRRVTNVDGHKFDVWTRSLASVSSRRGILAGFIFGTISGVIAAPGALRGLASSLQDDPDDCGDCPDGCDDRDPCTDDYCEDGRCIHKPIVCPDDGDPCTKNICANGECIAIKTDDTCDECNCNPDTQFCCKVGANQMCCTSGEQRCDYQAGGCYDISNQP